ncbi:hypothetical protein QEW_2132 [Clostridioides difficile CD160]|nr:hypothetical protein QEW_2132 [Clostridioides difficile CD160]
MFSKKEYIVVVCRDCFVFYNKDNGLKESVSFSIQPIPNVPFYHYLFEGETEKFIRDIQTKVSIKKSALYILIPDDALGIDIKVLQEFFIQLGCRKIIFSKQNILLSNCVEDYISISFTSRVVAISYVKSGGAESIDFFAYNEFDVKNISYIIKNLHNDCVYSDLKIYVNSIGISNNYEDIGKIVQVDGIVNNFKKLYIEKTHKDRIVSI